MLFRSDSEPETVKLDYNDLRIVFHGRESARRHLAAFIDHELVSRPMSQGCLNKHNDDGRVCRKSFYYVMLNLLQAIGGISHWRDADPLHSLSQTTGMLSRTDFSDGEKPCGLKICAACKSVLTSYVRAERKKVWKKIPEWFGLVRTEKNEVDISI